MHIILFDIDGTLINTGGAGIASLWQAFLSEFDVQKPDREFDFRGWTDRGIVSELFKAHDIENSPQNWQRFLQGYLQHLPTNLVKRQGIALSGVFSLLEKLQSRPNVLLGLLTGNVQQGAQIKLTHYELASYFEFGGYGDCHHDRNDVAKESLQAARVHLSQDVKITSTWVIGDTPQDIRCARAIEAQAVAVATGSYSSQELSNAKPDLLFEDLVEVELLLDLLI